MSRAFRIRVKESIKKTLRGSDEICSQMEILEVLPPEQMEQLLRGELKNRGYEEDGEMLVRREGGVSITINPKTGEVSVRAESQEDVELEGEREDWAYDDMGPGRKSVERRLQENLRQDLERRADQQEGRLQQRATEELEGVVNELQGELEQVINRVTAEALKQKAAQLGEIKEITEDPEAGSLTIKVEV